MKYTYLFILVFLGNSLLIAQNENKCEELKKNFKKAERIYSDGDLHRAISLLEYISDTNNKNKIKDCKETKLKAYSLLAKLYLLTNEDINATTNYKEVLEIDPKYKPSKQSEPTDMIFFANKFKAIPNYSITPEFHIVQTRDRILRESRTFRSVEAVMFQDSLVVPEFQNLDVTYKSKYSLGIGIRGSYYPTKRWEISGGYGINENKFVIEKKYIRNRGAITSNELISISETQLWNNFSAMIKYNCGKGKFRYNVFIGLEKNGLIHSHFTEATRGSFDLIEEVKNLEKNEYLNARGNRLKTTDLRSKHNHSKFWGFGFKYRPKKGLNRNFIELGFKFATFQKPLNNNKMDSKPIGENDIRRELIFGLGYMDDIIELRYSQITIGYSYTMYRVIEKRKRFKFKF